MADQQMNDLFMYIQDDKGNPVPGESSLQVAKKDDLMKDFEGADYDDYANFFDVTGFSFNLELDDSEKQGATNSTGPFSDWYMHKDLVQTLKGQYNVKKITGSIGKTLDSTSPILFQNCCNKKTFKKGVLVKRAFTGARVSQGDSQAQAYLRILMTNIRITEISWNDGDVVEEKLTFKCEHMEINYRKQRDDGGLEDLTQLLKWTWTTGQPK
jgi:type VI protein secretion system component Hcp